MSRGDTRVRHLRENQITDALRQRLMARGWSLRAIPDPDDPEGIVYQVVTANGIPLPSVELSTC